MQIIFKNEIYAKIISLYLNPITKFINIQMPIQSWRRFPSVLWLSTAPSLSRLARKEFNANKDQVTQLMIISYPYKAMSTWVSFMLCHISINLKMRPCSLFLASSTNIARSGRVPHHCGIIEKISISSTVLDGQIVIIMFSCSGLLLTI